MSQLMESETTALSAGEAAFVQNMVAGMLPTTAARAAGYANPTAIAKSMQERPNVVAAILKQKKRFADKNDMTRQKVLDGFLEAIDMAKTQGDPLAMISGWREIAKMCGFYEATKHKVEISVNGQVMHTQLQTMSDDELLKLAEKTQPIDVEVVETEEKT